MDLLLHGNSVIIDYHNFCNVSIPWKRIIYQSSDREFPWYVEFPAVNVKLYINDVYYTCVVVLFYAVKSSYQLDLITP